MSTPAGDVVRDAGVLERYHLLLTQLGFDSCVAISGEYTSAEGHNLTKETLYPALHAMIQKHGALGVQVRPGKTLKAAPHFVRLREIDLDTAVEFREDKTASADRLLRAELERPFELGTTAPLWRATVLNGCMVVFAFHHCIGDGQSGPALHAALWTALNSTQPTEGFSSTVAVPEGTSPVGPTEAYTKISVSAGGFAHMAHALFTPKKTQPYFRAWTGNAVPTVPSLDITVHCWSIPPSQTSALLRLCREHNTTLTAFLCALMTGVLARLLAERKLTPKVKAIAVEVPVSLRRFTGVSPLALCDQVSHAHLFCRLAPFPREGPFPWDVARKAGEDLHKQVPKTREILGMLRILLRTGSAEAYYRDKLGKKRESGMVLSNLGRFPVAAEEGAEWRLEQVYFAQSDVVQGSAMKVNVVGSPEGSTNVTFAWGKGAVEESLAEAFVEEMKAALDIVLG